MKTQFVPLFIAFFMMPSVTHAETNNNPPAALETIEGQNPDNPDHIQTLYKDLDEDGVADRFDHCLNSAPGSKVDRYGCEADTDSDGVFDRNDECPNTPANTAVNFLGCEADEDKDQVLDSIDQCRDTPLGAKVDATGCSEDDDKDGVMNANDLCPGTPKGAAVNRFGCAAGQTVLRSRNFPLNSIEIIIDPKLNLAEEAATMKKLGNDAVLLVIGHADSTGAADYNMTLSWARAEKGKEYVAEKFGVPADRIYIIGKGETEPVASNLTEQGRRLNRRIEMKIVDENKLPTLAEQSSPVSMKWTRK